jgi:hypothetical protein
MQESVNDGNEDLFNAFKNKMNNLLESPKSDEGLKKGMTNFTDFKKKKRTIPELQGKIIEFQKERDWFKREALILSK